MIDSGGTVDMGAYENTSRSVPAVCHSTKGPVRWTDEQRAQLKVVPTLDGCTFLPMGGTNQGSGFVNATNGLNYSGATTATLTFTNLTLSAHSEFSSWLRDSKSCLLPRPLPGCDVPFPAPPGGPPSVQGTVKQFRRVGNNDQHDLDLYRLQSR